MIDEGPVALPSHPGMTVNGLAGRLAEQGYHRRAGQPVLPGSSRFAADDVVTVTRSRAGSAGVRATASRSRSQKK